MNTKADVVVDEQEAANAQAAADQSAMEAAFAAVDIEIDPTPSKVTVEPEILAEKVEAKPEEEKPTEVTPTAPPTNGLSEEQIKLLSAIPEMERRLTQQADKVAGNYGEIKRVLDSMQKAVATPKGAAEFDASADGDYLDREFPDDLAPAVQRRIDAAIAKVPAGMNDEQLESWYANRKAAEYQGLIQILDTAHPDRVEVRESQGWKDWVSSLPVYEQSQLSNSEDPYYVAGMISKFKDHRDQQTSLQEKSKKRLENAITPRGVAPTGHSTITEEEAAQKAFEAQFD